MDTELRRYFRGTDKYRGDGPTPDCSPTTTVFRETEPIAWEVATADIVRSSTLWHKIKGGITYGRVVEGTQLASIAIMLGGAATSHWVVAGIGFAGLAGSNVVNLLGRWSAYLSE